MSAEPPRHPHRSSIGDSIAHESSNPAPPVDVDVDGLRARLETARGREFWRSLDEFANAAKAKVVDGLREEFSPGASEWGDGVSRRDFLRLTAASLALAGVTGCTKQPTQPILPYVNQPEEIVPGRPLFYASSMLLGGFATGVLVKSREGHPVKVEGNPDHPASLGSSSIWMQASLLDLYDPDRSQAVTRHAEISEWGRCLSELHDVLERSRAARGAGLRFLTESITSPTLAAQMRQLLKAFPEAKWHQWEPVNRDLPHEGARIAFGEIVEPQYRFDKAAVILSLDADFLYAHPERLRYTRQFTDGRRASAERKDANRLYVVESTPTVTGSMADHRWPLSPSEIEAFTHRLAASFGLDFPGSSASARTVDARRLAALRTDLETHRGRCVVVAGEWQPAWIHAAAHWLNERLGNVGTTVLYAPSAAAEPVNQLASVRALADDMHAGRVSALLILGGNPAYNAPSDLAFADALAKTRFSLHLGLEANETAARCTWHVPQAHYLESWGDARSFDGTASLIQPLIMPLYDGKTAHELLDICQLQQPVRGAYEIVRDYWRSQNLWPDFELGWRKALHDGLIAGSAAAPKEVRVRSDFARQLQADSTSSSEQGPVILFRPDPNVWDGQFANNGWLQECPKPITKLTWDNAALVSPALAQQLGFKSGDVAQLEVNGRKLLAPVWIAPGQADNAITVHLGYGRSEAGRVGKGIGCNANLVRTATGLWTGQGSRIVRTARRRQLVATQTHHNVHSSERQIYRVGTWQQFVDHPEFVKESVEIPGKEETLYNPGQYDNSGYKWGMSIDLTTCVGCNSCLVACEVENNIPVVGKDQVSRNREMSWIRVDTYYEGSPENPAFHHMPVPCMHCEHAPCELVCPTAATVHDHEGLNLQVYNRCVGTRFCSNNCPYKVRRFNFLQYADYHSPSLGPMHNPEVTVRWRGVMEKCTYCIQRISAARIEAEKGNRRIRDGAVKTACQQACPADAIVFGDLNDPDSRIARLKAHLLDYPMLGELNTRPRTTYLAKLTNPNPALSDKGSA